MTTTTLTETVPAHLVKYLTEAQHREATIEHVDADRGTMLVRGAPYNVEAELVPGVFESFAPHTFERAANPGAASRSKLWLLHDMEQPPVGYGLTVEDRDDGVWIDYKFSKTRRAQEAREMAADGTLDQVSVTFNLMRDGWVKEHRDDGWHIRHRRAHLLGVALVPHGAYGDGAFVAAVRDLEGAEREAQRRLDSLSYVRSLQQLTH